MDFRITWVRITWILLYWLLFYDMSVIKHCFIIINILFRLETFLETNFFKDIFFKNSVLVSQICKKLFISFLDQLHLTFNLTLSWRRSLSYGNQSIDLDWFLYDTDIHHERVKCLRGFYQRVQSKTNTIQWSWCVTFLHHIFYSPLLFSSFCFNFSLLLLSVFTFFQQFFIKSFLINEYQRVLINKSTLVCKSPVQVNASQHFLLFHTFLTLCKSIVIASAFGYCQLIPTLSGKFYSIRYSLIRHFFSATLYFLECRLFLSYLCLASFYATLCFWWWFSLYICPTSSIISYFYINNLFL